MNVDIAEYWLIFIKLANYMTIVLLLLQLGAFISKCFIYVVSKTLCVSFAALSRMRHSRYSIYLCPISLIMTWKYTAESKQEGIDIRLHVHNQVIHYNRTISLNAGQDVICGGTVIKCSRLKF